MNKLDDLIENDLFNFVIVNIISSDHLIDKESCIKSLNLLDVLESDLETSILKTENVEKDLKRAKEIVIRDLELYE